MQYQRFGLDGQGRTESVMVSAPPLIAWKYRVEPKPGSEEEKLTNVSFHLHMCFSFVHIVNLNSELQPCHHHFLHITGVCYQVLASPKEWA
jgi:hypothetical protein